MSASFLTSIVHTTDFSQASYQAFCQALALSLTGNTTLSLLNVGVKAPADVDWRAYPSVRDTLQRWNLLEKGAPRSAVQQQLGVQVKKAAVRALSPAIAVSEFVQDQAADLIVLSAGKPDGIEKLTHRSVSAAIARRSRVPTLFVPEQARRGLVSVADGSGSLARILVPVDTRPHPQAAITMARRMAENFGEARVEITLLHVGRSGYRVPSQPDGAQIRWRSETRSGDVTDALRQAETELYPDLIVLTTAGREGMLEALRGSTSERVVRESSCPVLAVPTKAA